jgi:D-alanyl-D-alanine carboxypeptidase
LIGPIGGLCSPRPGRRLVIALSGGGRAPLGLRDSYLHADPADDRPVRIMSRNGRCICRAACSSISAEGGMVSTGTDLLVSGRAAFEGQLFDIDALLAQQNWRMVFWPGQFYFGLGLEKLWTPWLIAPVHPIRDVIGCWGQTGAFVFHHPQTGLHFAGTVNQASGWGHVSAIRAMLRIIKAVRA